MCMCTRVIVKELALSWNPLKLDQVADLVMTRLCVAVNQPSFSVLIDRHTNMCKARSVTEWVKLDVYG